MVANGAISVTFVILISIKISFILKCHIMDTLISQPLNTTSQLQGPRPFKFFENKIGSISH